MKLVATKAWILWGALADGKRQHVRDLAQLIGCDAHALYGQWKQLPNEIQKQLRQHDGWWQLKQAMAVVSPVQAASISDNTGFKWRYCLKPRLPTMCCGSAGTMGKTYTNTWCVLWSKAKAVAACKGLGKMCQGKL